MLRILFIGENWYGSNARSCVMSLRFLGHDVSEIDSQTFFPRATTWTSKVVRRLCLPKFIEEFNNSILREAELFQPDILIAFKGNYIYAETLRSLRRGGIALYNYFPDTSAFNHGKWIPKSLPEYDCIFHTKRFWYSDTTKQIPLRAGCFLDHGYSPSVHRPLALDARDISDYRCDVSFIANHTQYKEMILNDLVKLRPELNLCIWGGYWARCGSPSLRRCIKGFQLNGSRYVRGVQAARINLAIMTGRVQGSSSGDLTTSRTFTIPASGGFMLHERNPEVLGLYREGEEIECFDSVEELARKIDFYLEHPQAREQIARAGYARCVPAYSYDNRMAELVQWHHNQPGARDQQIVLAQRMESVATGATNLANQPAAREE